MGTSRSRSTLRIPSHASDEEAAAIAAALDAFIQAEHEGPSAEPAWDGRRWAFVGRIEALQRRSVDPPSRAPIDPWRAAGRTDRMR